MLGTLGNLAGRVRQGIFISANYFREVVIELKKVRWPTRKELLGYTVTVVSVCALMFVLTYGFDLLVTQAFQWLGIGA